MGTLDKPTGFFDLSNSDNSIGSFLSRHDIKEILSVQDNDLSEVPFINMHGMEYIDEGDMQKLWYDGKVSNSPPSKIGNSKISFDELILKAIIQKTYPTALIETQISWGRKKVDFRVQINNQQKLIEFHGPGHFTNIGYGIPDDPLIRKKALEDHFGIECVIWPYWIQRCSTNVKAIFENNIKGFGALWSTNIHFGDFLFPNSAEIINVLTNRFNAVGSSGYGYFYEGNPNLRNKPEHPIVEKISKGKINRKKILPQGNTDPNYWLPDKLTFI